MHSVQIHLVSSIHFAHPKCKTMKRKQSRRINQIVPIRWVAACSSVVRSGSFPYKVTKRARHSSVLFHLTYGIPAASKKYTIHVVRLNHFLPIFPLICLEIRARIAENIIQESQSLELVARFFTAIIASHFSDDSPVRTHTANDKSCVVVFLMANGPGAQSDGFPVTLHL